MSWWQEVLITIMALMSMLLSSLGLAPRTSSPTPSPTPTPAASPRASRDDYRIEAGKASYVRASLGDLYLALPRHERGTLVRVCGEGGCVERRSTDVGPDQNVFPDRIADLSRRDFETVSGGSPETLGTCTVTVEFLGP